MSGSGKTRQEADLVVPHKPLDFTCEQSGTVHADAGRANRADNAGPQKRFIGHGIQTLTDFHRLCRTVWHDVT